MKKLFAHYLSNKFIFSLLIGLSFAYLLPASASASASASSSTPKSTPEEVAVLDVLFLYSDSVYDRQKGRVTEKIDHLVSLTNTIFNGSRIGAKVRRAGMKRLQLSDRETNVALLKRMKAQRGEFQDVSRWREEFKADMVVLVRPNPIGSCGVAYITTSPNVHLYKNNMFSVISLSGCPSHVLAHELGHNLGLTHSEKQGGMQGIFRYARGYGQSGEFVTVMAYPSAFAKTITKKKKKKKKGLFKKKRKKKTETIYPKVVYKFSSPQLDCIGRPCGIDSNARNAADARKALFYTIPRVARFYGEETNSEGRQTRNERQESSNTESSFRYSKLLDIPIDTISKGSGRSRPIFLINRSDRLMVTARGGDGDCDLFLSTNLKLSNILTDHLSASQSPDTNNETIVIDEPTSRFYFVTLYGVRSSCEGVSVTALSGAKEY